MKTLCNNQPPYRSNSVKIGSTTMDTSHPNHAHHSNYTENHAQNPVQSSQLFVPAQPFVPGQSYMSPPSVLPTQSFQQVQHQPQAKN